MGEREDENVDIEIEVGMERQVSGALSDDNELSSLREPLLILHQTKRTNNTSQLAVVGANVCSIESLDYEYVEECISCIQYIYIYIYITFFVCQLWDPHHPMLSARTKMHLFIHKIIIIFLQSHDDITLW